MTHIVQFGAKVAAVVVAIDDSRTYNDKVLVADYCLDAPDVIPTGALHFIPEPGGFLKPFAYTEVWYRGC